MTARRWIGALYLGLLVMSFLLAGLIPGWTVLDVRPTNEPEVHRIIMGLMVLYMVLAAVPFVPGAEIGFGLLAVFGGQAAFLVYAGMVGALTIAFLAGRLLPPDMVSRFFGWLGMNRARALVEECHSMALDQRAAFLAERVPTRVLPYLLRHPYLTLAVLLNLPGNTFLGGGGGIAFAAGASRIYPASGYLLTIALAVLPVPLMFRLFW